MRVISQRSLERVDLCLHLVNYPGLQVDFLRQHEYLLFVLCLCASQLFVHVLHVLELVTQLGLLLQLLYLPRQRLILRLRNKQLLRQIRRFFRGLHLLVLGQDVVFPQCLQSPLLIFADHRLLLELTERLAQLDNVILLVRQLVDEFVVGVYGFVQLRLRQVSRPGQHVRGLREA